MNDGSEHLNGCSQWIRVRFQIMITNIREGNRIVTFLCQISFSWSVLDGSGGVITGADHFTARPHLNRKRFLELFPLPG